jgi:hypothetical protein
MLLVAIFTPVETGRRIKGGGPVSHCRSAKDLGLSAGIGPCGEYKASEDRSDKAKKKGAAAPRNLPPMAAVLATAHHFLLF